MVNKTLKQKLASFVKKCANGPSRNGRCPRKCSYGKRLTTGYCPRRRYVQLNGVDMFTDRSRKSRKSRS